METEEEEEKKYHMPSRESPHTITIDNCVYLMLINSGNIFYERKNCNESKQYMYRQSE